MMRQSVQTVLPESTGNNTLSLRDSVCRDLFQLFSFSHSPLQYYLFQACLSGKGIIRATSFSRVGIAASYVPRFIS
ncbi:DNA replication/recombination/repair protein [Escherichia coli]|uniref:DNA replication/recombination/repair protein n=1 Tax=Escherichia coli TaxID=562 RepID=A0A377KDN5_ECOLX|nr:DNA replication/recombination/repair protein [Escherichia coli]